LNSAAAPALSTSSRVATMMAATFFGSTNPAPKTSDEIGFTPPSPGTLPVMPVLMM
jgi:hypothetical protein